MVPVPRHARRAFVRAAILVPLAGFAPRGSAAEEQSISEAERLLFATNHLEHVRPQSTIRYAFRKTGSLEQGFSDTVELDVGVEDAGGKAVEARFLSGPRRREYPSLPHAEGNPVVMFFLEREIREMQRLTGGGADYFRKRIRLALAERAQVEAARIRTAGGNADARRITIEPYADDPNKDRETFQPFIGKRYTFTISESVPGWIYEIETRVPGAQPSDAPKLDEKLTFAGSGPRVRRAPPAPPTAASEAKKS